MPDPTDDLNTVIVSAVNARVEAEMMKALGGDETVGRFVAAALRQTVEVAVPGTYQKTKEPFLTNVLRRAIQEAATAACKRLILDELPSIEDAVRKTLRRDIAVVAETLVSSLAQAADKPYGFNVALQLNMPSRD